MSERFTVHLDEIQKRLQYHAACQNSILMDDSIDFLITSIGKCIVANGCFDLPHPGHLSLFGWLDTIAYQRNLRPIVAMNSDASVRRLKGSGRPAWPQEARSLFINHLKWPLTVVIFDEDTPQRLMDVLQPQVVVKGSEYATGDVIRWKDSEVITVPMVEGWSTSRILGDTR